MFLQDFWPDLGQGLHAQEVPPYFQHLNILIKEAVNRKVVQVDKLELATAKFIYKDYTTDFPPPKIMEKYELPWDIVFARLWDNVLEPPIQSLMFLLVHNILPIRTRLHRMNMTNNDKCLTDGLIEDVEHVFCHCVKTREAWQWIRWKITNEWIPINFPIPSDFELLNLCFESPFEKELIWLIGSYVHLVLDIFQRSAIHIDVDQMKIDLQQLYRQNQAGQNKVGMILW